MKKPTAGLMSFTKIGYRLLNVHVWTLQAEGHTKVMYGVTVFGLSIDFSTL